MITTHSLQGYPFNIELAGLRGNTRSMQENGWEISVDTAELYDRNSYRIRLAGRHLKLNLRILSGSIELDVGYFLRNIDSPSFRNYHDSSLVGGHRGMQFHTRKGTVNVGLPFDHFVIPISFVGPSIVVNIPKERFGWRAVDFTSPEMIRQEFDHFDLDDIAMFKFVGNEKELFVPEKKIVEVQDYLQDIIKSQEEKQAEIRKKMLSNQNVSDTKTLNENNKLRLVGY